MAGLPRWAKLLGIAVAVLAALVGLYAYVGYEVAPGIVREQAQKYVRAEFGKDLTIGAIKTDPFGFKVEITDIAIPDGATPMVAAKRVFVDYDFSSSFRESFRLDRIDIDQPRINAVVRPDGRLNLLELVPKPSDEPFPPVLIALVNVTGGAAAFSDLSRADRPATRLDPISFTLRDLHTLRDEGGRLKLTATSDGGEDFAWVGKVSMEPLASSGGVGIAGLKASTIQKFAGDFLPVRLADGRVDVKLAYDAAYGKDGARLAARLPMLRIAGLNGSMAGTDAAVRLGGLNLDGASLRLRMPAGGDPVYEAAVPKIALSDLAIDGTGPAAGQKLAMTSLEVEAIRGAPGAGIASVGALRAAGIKFVPHPSVFHGDLAVETLEVPQGVAATLGPGGGLPAVAEMPAVALRGFRMDGTGPARGQFTKIATVDLGAIRYATQGNVASVGTTRVRGIDVLTDRDAKSRIGLLRLLPVSPAKAGEPNYRLGFGTFVADDIRMKIVDHYVRPEITYVVSPVTIRAKGDGKDVYNPIDADIAGKVNGKWGFAAKGRLDVGALAADMRVKLDSVPLTAALPYAPPLPGVALTGGTLGVDGRAVYRGGVARFDGGVTVANLRMIETARRTDLLRWRNLALTGISGSMKGATIARARLDGLVGQVAILEDGTFNFSRIVEDNPAPVVQVGTAPPPKKLSRAEKRAEKARIAAEKEQTKRAAYAKLDARMVQPDIPVTVRRLELSAGTLAFADRSIEPNFAARIEALRGTVLNVSNRPDVIASLDLKGQVINRFSPVTIKGSIYPLAYDRKTRLDVAFRNIELPVFNPYSGRYAGYAIDKGKLTTELSYTIDRRVLDAKHHIKVDGLQWGEATESKDKVPLPIRMATSLMKDKNGVIELDVPVNGTLDDPAFRVWPIIWKVFGNAVRNIITAPFKALGSLFGGKAEQAQFVDFAPGSATLPEGAAGTLGELAKALGEKPDLKLDIPSGPAGEIDAKAIADQKIAEAAMAKEVKKGGKADLAALDPGKRHDRLKDLYKAKFGKSPEFPAAPSKDEKGDARRIREADWMQAELRAKFQPGAPQLAELGTARGEAVRAALLADSGLDPARVFLASGDSVTEKDGKARMELKLN